MVSRLEAVTQLFAWKGEPWILNLQLSWISAPQNSLPELCPWPLEQEIRGLNSDAPAPFSPYRQLGLATIPHAFFRNAPLLRLVRRLFLTKTET